MRSVNLTIKGDLSYTIYKSVLRKTSMQVFSHAYKNVETNFASLALVGVLSKLHEGYDDF